MIGVIEFVLGQRDDAVFIELSEEDAIQPARAGQANPLRLRKFAEPDPEAVAERQRFRDSGQRVTLASRLRTITVQVNVSGEVAGEWAPGRLLTFPKQSEAAIRPSITGHFTWSRDINAVFLSARQAGPTRFDVTRVVEPRGIYSCSAGGRTRPDGGADGNRCTVGER